MSRRRLERLLPDLSVTPNRGVELQLSHLNQRDGRGDLDARRAEFEQAVYRSVIWSLSRLGCVPIIHFGQLATTTDWRQPVSASEETDERARR